MENLEVVKNMIVSGTKKQKVLLLENISVTAIKMFEDCGFEVESEKSSLTKEKLIERISSVSIVGVR